MTCWRATYDQLCFKKYLIFFYLDSFVPPRSTTITRYDSPSHTINSELRSEVNKSQRDILERPHDGAVLVLIIFIKG